MKKIKIQYADMFRGFDPKNNEYNDLLGKYYDIELSDKPDYVIYSVFGNDHLKYDCIRIFYTGECVTPNFNECDYAIGFDRLTFADRYRRIPYYVLHGCEENYQQLFERKPFQKEDLQEKQGFCNFVVSNCFGDARREELFHALNAYKPVDSAGRYLNNIGGAVQDKKAFQARYKFSIAVENASYSGYTTEKIVDAFAAYTIPVYFGDPDVALDFNPKAFINCHDYASLEEIVEAVKEVDNDDERYLQMINANPILQKQDIHAQETYFRYIMDQPLETARRRPISMYTKANEARVLRHNGFEKYIYTSYRRAKNQLERIRTGTFLTNRRTK